MMLDFLSPLWAARLCEALNASDEYRRAASDWEGDVLLVATGVPRELGVGSRGAARLRLSRGRCLDAELLDEGSLQGVEARYVFEAELSTWIAIFEGRLKPVPALALGKVKLRRGRLAELLKYADAATVMLEVARSLVERSQQRGQ